MAPFGNMKLETPSPIGHVVPNRRIEEEGLVSRVKTSESSFCLRSLRPLVETFQTKRNDYKIGTILTRLEETEGDLRQDALIVKRGEIAAIIVDDGCHTTC